jgi:DNA-binding NarL/FixJ family response regulator
MVFLVNIAGLVIVLNGPVIPSLARLAMRQGWPVMKMASAKQAAPRVLRRQANVHVVQVSACMDEEADLIRLLRAAPRRVPLVAVSTLHDPWVERAAREAGADCYLPGLESPEVLQRMIESLVPQDASVAQWRRHASSG